MLERQRGSERKRKMRKGWTEREREREMHVGASKLPRGSMTAAVNQSSDRD